MQPICNWVFPVPALPKNQFVKQLMKPRTINQGVEQLVIDLNGGIGKGKLANKVNATIKEIYINEARYCLDTKIPNWTKELKFQ